ncbi:MAG: SWIM zinc finger family protein [Ilumatobacter sp.]
MSRPRKPYGQNLPGRLMGTMIKVLAAEMSDQARLSRGKRYWADDAVIDIVVGHGAVTAEIQGSRQQPYVVTIEASGGAGVPSRREIWAQCTCPDDAGTGVDLCKHAVAAFFSLADEVTLEPELLDRWRASRRPVRDDSNVTDLTDARRSTHRGGKVDDEDDADEDDADEDDADEDDADENDEDESGPDADVIELRTRYEPEFDAISALLQSPAGAAPPAFPEVTDLDHGTIRNRLLADVLADVLDHLEIRWD